MRCSLTKKQYNKTLFIFRRDLRLEDNTGLIFALKNSQSVIPCFIFTPEQIEHNPYRSDHFLQFMLESLADLREALKKKKGELYYFYGTPEDVASRCIESLQIDALVVNRDYTPYSRARDEKLKALCEKNRLDFHSFDDALLHPPETTLKANGKPYLIFTPYFRNASELEVAPATENRYSNYFQGAIDFAKKSPPLPKINLSNAFRGGRSEALNILKHLGNKSEATGLSAYLKLTLISPRELYQQIRMRPNLLRSLYWRDFFTGVAFFFPHVFQGPFYSKYNSISWINDLKMFKRWCEGSTGFPIIDAGMRQMNQTGFMPNRVRMITASFLIKNLRIDWRWGEKYFAQHLIDYDPAVNNGNWQWVAGTGCCAQPIFRTFNPLTQQKKFDPEFLYIRQWVPEWDTSSYPEPMVNLKKSK